MRNRIFLKVLAAFVAVIAVATLTLDISIRHTWENSLTSNLQLWLVQNARAFALRIENDHTHSLQQMAQDEARITETRATIIAHDGTVLADSQADARTMENHAGRPEVAAVLHGSTGASSRLSHTVGIEFLYVAVPSGDKVARLAYPLSTIRSQISGIQRALLHATALALLFALALAFGVAQIIAARLRRIVRFAEQVASGDLTARIAETSGDEIGQVASALDRTARRLEENFAAVRESRSQLEALLNSMNDGVIAVSPELKVLWANQAIAAIAQHPVAIGSPVTELVRHPDFLRTLDSALRSKQRESAIAASLFGRRSFSITAEPLPDGGVVSVLHDISDIERVEKTRRDFIANVSHELRTPLTSIQGYAETLLENDEIASSGAREFLQVIRRNAERMGRLTEDLLVLARVESGEEKLDLRPHSARQLVAEAAASMQESARAAGVELAIADVPDTHVMADAYAIHQVFGNLISNAMRYAPTGKKVVIGAEQQAQKTRFFVRDFGPGIPSEHLPRIFERFYRVDKARSRESGGTGLGLAIVKHIVLNHGGTVSVDSIMGHGSTFYFSLPAA
ncbi:MAG TPA: ATP-binding protein [Candidatus Limnocylindrales bacterium]|nr:ATP-binding protein [Candidatus Limnocylindrales bacterium]